MSHGSKKEQTDQKFFQITKIAHGTTEVKHKQYEHNYFNVSEFSDHLNRRPVKHE